MSFKDLEEFIEPWLDLPIKGKTYRVASVDAETGLWSQRIVELAASVRAGAAVEDADVARLKLDDDQEREFYRSMLPGVDEDKEPVLGGAYDEMVADNVPWSYIKLAARTAFMWTVQDKEQAEEFWAAGGSSPKAPAKAPQDRQPKKARKK